MRRILYALFFKARNSSFYGILLEFLNGHKSPKDFEHNFPPPVNHSRAAGFEREVCNYINS